MLIEYSALDVVSSYVYLQSNETNIMPFEENYPTFGNVNVGNFPTLEDALSTYPTATSNEPTPDPADRVTDEFQSELA